MAAANTGTRPTLADLNHCYRTLKDRRTALLRDNEIELAEREHRLASIEAQLGEVSEQRRLLSKPSRQQAAAERREQLAGQVATLTASERAALREMLEED